MFQRRFLIFNLRYKIILMERNYRQEPTLDNNYPHPLIPPEYLLSAMGQIAFDKGGEQLHREVMTLNETSESNLPNAEAVSLLADKDPNALELVLTLAEQMDEDAFSRRRKKERKIDRREKMPQWLRAAGWATLKAMGACSLHGNSMIVPPEEH
jgi:hypothetical protein